LGSSISAVNMLVFASLLLCHQTLVAIGGAATYHSYGSVTAQPIYEKAITDFESLAKTSTGVDFQPFPVVIYEPGSMTDQEVTDCIDFISNYDPWWRPTVDDIRSGNLCGGVCGVKPVLVYTAHAGSTDAEIQEHAVHEANHVFQIQNSAVRFSTDSGDDGEDWRANGPRWWGEGASTWMGDRVLRAYPSLYTTPDPQRTNYGYTLADNCKGFKEVSESQNLRLTDAIQASDDPWQKLWSPSFEVTRDGLTFTTNAYFSLVYEGGYCACEYMFSEIGLDTQVQAGMRTAIEMVLKLEASPKLVNSWERAFLQIFDGFASMQNFYEGFEAAHGASGEYSYLAPLPPSGCNENGCGEYQNQAFPPSPPPVFPLNESSTDDDNTHISHAIKTKVLLVLGATGYHLI